MLKKLLVLVFAVLFAPLIRAQTEISFYYPVAVGGPITKIVDGYAAAFEKENPGVKVKPIYSGTYQESIVKALTANKAGEPPVLSVLLSTDMFSLIDEDAIVSWDELIRTDADRAWHASFFPGFMENSQTGGKTWGVPFQRSTIVLYWYKELFREAGLDANKAPANWNEMVELAKKLLPCVQAWHHAQHLRLRKCYQLLFSSDHPREPFPYLIQYQLCLIPNHLCKVFSPH